MIKPPALLYEQATRCGAYFWYRATGSDQMESATERMRYHEIARIFDDHGWELPSPAEMYAYAQDNFPADQLHSFDGAVD